jgi:hypothetical protein
MVRPQEEQAMKRPRRNQTAVAAANRKQIWNPCKVDRSMKVFRKLNPELIEEWNFVRNGELNPHDFSSGSHKKVWWKCKKGHEWEAVIHSRSYGKKCPYCSGQKVNHENSLAALIPALAGEWSNERNDCITPDTIASRSNKRVWWRCSKGHEWRATVYSRAKGSKCPFCVSRAVCSENSLLAVMPELSSEWHPTKNGTLQPDMVLPKSSRTVWWKCKNGHEWQALLSNRANGSLCPYCQGKLASKENCLSLVNPKLAQEWHPTKNGRLTPGELTPKSARRVWWKCKLDHEWKASVSDRAGGTECPYCKNRVAHWGNCLATSTLNWQVNGMLAKM